MILIKHELNENISAVSPIYQYISPAQVLTIFLKYDLLSVSKLINCKCINRGVVHNCYGSCLVNELGSCVSYKVIGAAYVDELE